MTDAEITAFCITSVFLICFALMAHFDNRAYQRVLKRLDKLEKEFNSSEEEIK